MNIKVLEKNDIRGCVKITKHKKMRRYTGVKVTNYKGVCGNNWLQNGVKMIGYKTV